MLTVIEVLSAEFLKGAIHDIPEAAVTLQAIKAILLLGIAIIKSSLVIWFYMHLKSEKPLIAIVILLPLLIAGLSIMFLLAIPPGGYSLLNIIVDAPPLRLIQAQVCYTGAQARVGG